MIAPYFISKRGKFPMDQRMQQAKAFFFDIENTMYDVIGPGIKATAYFLPAAAATPSGYKSTSRSNCNMKSPPTKWRILPRPLSRKRAKPDTLMPKKR